MTKDGVVLFFSTEQTEAFVWCISGASGLYVIDRKDFSQLWPQLDVGAEVAFSARESAAMFHIDDIHSINGVPVSCQAG